MSLDQPPASSSPAPPAPVASTSAADLPKPTHQRSAQQSQPAAAPDSDEDPLEIFSSGLFSTFDHVVPWHGDPSSSYTYTPPAGALPPAGTLTITVPPQAITALHADAIWDASLLVANSICTGEVDVKGKRVAELGAGAGLPSLIAARYGAAHVALTDYDDPDLVANMERNRMVLSEEERDRLVVQGYCWGNSVEGTKLDAHSYDLVLLADTLWMPDAHHLLVASVTLLLAQSSSARIVLVAGFHTGRACVRSFERRAAEAGLVGRGGWEEVSFAGERRRWGWDMEQATWEGEEDIAERNRWVVQGELGWSDEKLEQFARGVV